MADLDRQLRLADDVIRHKIVRVPEAAISGNKRKVSLEDIDTTPDRGDRRSSRDRDKD
jgi:ribosomal protein S6